MVICTVIQKVSRKHKHKRSYILRKLYIPRKLNYITSWENLLAPKNVNIYNDMFNSFHTYFMYFMLVYLCRSVFIKQLGKLCTCIYVLETCS